jgi:hypothetical protein
LSALTGAVRLIEQQPPTPSSVNHPVGSGYFRED